MIRGPYSSTCRSPALALRLLGALVVALGLLAMLPDRAVAEPRISWRVENPFRLFTRPSDSEVHRATYNDLGETERTTPVLSAERALSRRHPGDGWAAGMMDNLCWSAERNRYGCRESPDYLH